VSVIDRPDAAVVAGWARRRLVFGTTGIHDGRELFAVV
jgi:hypothetical protein